MSQHRPEWKVISLEYEQCETQLISGSAEQYISTACYILSPSCHNLLEKHSQSSTHVTLNAGKVIQTGIKKSI